MRTSVSRGEGEAEFVAERETETVDDGDGL